MASFITDIYVSIEGSSFVKLDLFKDESFILKSTKKDLQDVSKVFAPYSQSFSFPATQKNKSALGFFGNTQVLKINPDNRFKCKIYINGVIYQTGILTLESVKYKSGKAENFVGAFATNFLSIKDRIGDDKLNDLNNFTIDWKPTNVISTITSVVSDSGFRYYTPLISNNRVWNFDLDNAGIDNIAYKTGLDPYGNNVINIGELRPAISFSSIINLIKAKYDLTITIPLEAEPELQNLFTWCNGPNFNAGVKKFALTKAFDVNDQPSVLTASNNLTDSSTKLVKGTDLRIVTYRINLKNIVIGDNLATANLKISIVRKSTFETVLVSNFEIKNANFGDFDIRIPLYLFQSNEFEFFTFVECDKPVFWRMNTVFMIYRTLLGFEFNSICIDSYNSNTTGLSLVNIFKAFPDVKVIDFLNSFLKGFNISIFDNSPTNENLLFLNQTDIDNTLAIYGKSQLDYTPYFNNSEVEKKTNNPYNYYNFKHKTSKYKSNVDFKNQFNIEFGQTYFPAVKPKDAKEYKVETAFSILPVVNINGTQTPTSYGFTSDSPSVDDAGRFRYTPNNDELTIFYSHGLSTVSESAGFAIQNNDTINLLNVVKLTNYVKTLPYCKENNYSLGFSILKIFNVEYTETLFKRYYQFFIQRILNPNALSQVLSFTLPSNEIYLNDANNKIGSVLRPKGFRLQNEIIVEETRYEILESSIDATTGKTKLTLLNF